MRALPVESVDDDDDGHHDDDDDDGDDDDGYEWIPAQTCCWR